MVICLQRGADLHMARLMPLPLTVSCFSKILIGFTFLVPAHLGSPGKRAIKHMCVCLLGFVTSTIWAQFTKYLAIILRHAKVTIDLRRTPNLQNIS